MRTLALALLLSAGAASAQTARQLGVGPIIGDPTGLTAKYFFEDGHAVDFGLGASHSLTLWGDYVWHGWQAIPQPQRGRLEVYLAAGPRIETQKKTDFGIRTMGGVAFWPRMNRVFEMFLELGPVYRLVPDVRVRVDGGFGVRYYFSPLERRTGPRR